MTDQGARLLVAAGCILAEGIQWHSGRRRLYWTDIHGARFCSAAADGGDLVVHTLPERLGAFAFDPDDRLLGAFASGLHVFDPTTGARRLLAAFEPEQPSTRLNDGRCDRQGRFVVGGIDEAGLRPLSSVIRWDGHAAQTLFGNVGCSNGIGFSPDGRVFYFADTAGHTLWQHDYDPASGAIGPRRVFAELGPGEGRPDGSTVDAEGGVWNAQFGGGCVQRFRPDGTRDRRITLPVAQVTCCCFGGPDLSRLYITTAREGYTAADLAREPLAGSIFVAEVGVRGLPEVGLTTRLPPL